MKTVTRAALVLILLGGLIGCKSSNDGDGGNGNIIPPDTSSSSTSSSGGNITNTALPVYESFGSYTNFDQADVIDFFSTNYKALATPAGSDPRPSFYYPTCCFFESDDPNSNITVDHQNRMGVISDNGDPSLLLSNTRFSIAQTLSPLASASATDPKKDSTPGTAGAGQSWGELDLSQPYKISFCVADASGTGSSTQIYVDNNTTGEANSIHGGGSTGSRIFNVPTSDLVPGQRVEIEIPGDTTLMPGGPVVTTKTAQVGTANSFLQFRVSSGGSAIIDDLLIEYQSDVGNTPVPACQVFTPATAPGTPAAPNLSAGDGQINVTWAGVLGATSYDILYNTTDSTTAGLPQTIDDVTATNTTITGLTNGTPYYVFIRASNSAGDSNYSSSASATPTAPGPGCTPTTMVPASPTNGILWNVYDGCLDPNSAGAVILNGSTSSNFDFSGSSDSALFTANGDGTASLDATALGDDRSYGDIDGIVNDTGTYPKTFTFIARVDTPTNLHRGFEIEAGFADTGMTGSRVKMILRPDSGADGLIQLERISGGTSSDDTSESEQAMSDGYHIYHVSYTLSDARTITAVIYRDGIDISSSFDLDITDVTPRDGTDNHIRIGENGSSTYRADIDWIVWTNDPTAAALTPAQLEGELPEDIGELGPYASPSAPVWTTAELDLVGASGSVPSGSISQNTATDVTITASGGNMSSSGHRVYFAYQEVTGDFTFTARVVSITPTATLTNLNNNAYRYGIMIMDDINPAPDYGSLARWASLGYYALTDTPTFQGSRTVKEDSAPGATRSRSNEDQVVGTYYLRITRTGTAYTLEISPDDVTYSVERSGNFTAVDDTWYVGMFAAPDEEVTIVYDNISIVQ
ncbi:MAG TPA: hypothetical protein VF268_08050 [Gammaproteobacteria bacterium]